MTFDHNQPHGQVINFLTNPNRSATASYKNKKTQHFLIT